MTRQLRYSYLVTAWLALGGVAAAAADGGLYTPEQVKRGRAIYRAECSVCHSPDLNGRKADGGPALRGAAFLQRWRGEPVGTLIDPAQELMPAAHPGKLGRQAYVDVIAYILERNGAPAGVFELPTDAAALKKLPIAFGPVR